MWLKLREQEEVKLRRPDGSHKGLDRCARASFLHLFLGTARAWVWLRSVVVVDSPLRQAVEARACLTGEKSCILQKRRCFYTPDWVLLWCLGFLILCTFQRSDNALVQVLNFHYSFIS